MTKRKHLDVLYGVYSLSRKAQFVRDSREDLLNRRQGIINAMGCGWRGRLNEARLAEIDRQLRELKCGNQNQTQPDRSTVSPLRSVGNVPATRRQDG